MKRAERKVKIYACKNATKSSRTLNKVQLRTLIPVTVIHSPIEYVAAAVIMPMIPRSTKCPATILANSRTAKMRCLIHKPSISIAKIIGFKMIASGSGRSMEGI